MTQTMARPLAVPISGMDENRRREIIDGLNACLANMIDLSTAAKQAHWNVHGPNFAGLHELFDVITEETRGYADDLAERLVSLGGMAHGTVQDAVESSNLEAFPRDDRQWEDLASGMRDRMLKTSERCRSYANSMDDDIATQDIYIQIMRGLEKRAWMLDAHLRGYR